MATVITAAATTSSASLMVRAAGDDPAPHKLVNNPISCARWVKTETSRLDAMTHELGIELSTELRVQPQPKSTEQQSPSVLSAPHAAMISYWFIGLSVWG